MPAAVDELTDLQRRLHGLISSPGYQVPRRNAEVDALVVPVEVNHNHGTGSLLWKMFPNDRNIACIRSMTIYNGVNDFGDLDILMRHENMSRMEQYSQVARELDGVNVKRIFCVPYSTDDVRNATIIHDLYNAPMCTQIMDDHNVAYAGIPDDLMREFLEKCDIRFAISPEMRDAYEVKYQMKFWFLPGVLEDKLIASTVQLPTGPLAEKKTGVLVGNVWSQKWLDSLRETIRGTGLKIHWYGATGNAHLEFDRAQMARDGIELKGFLPEAELASVLKRYPYAILPSGQLDEGDSRCAIAKYSLPSRISFIQCSSHLPMIVLGSADTAAAKWVLRQKTGVAAEYRSEDFVRAVESICSPDVQHTLRNRAAEQAPLFSNAGLTDWIWNSLARREPMDDRFEKLARRHPDQYAYYFEWPSPNEIFSGFHDIHQAMRRLKNQGYSPDFVLDVGASVGIWSDTVSKVFPDARFVLFEPLLEQYPEDGRAYYLGRHPEFEVVRAAVSDKPGQATFHVSDHLYCSSLLQPSGANYTKAVEIPVTTLDETAARLNLQGRGIAKIDVQCAEHFVLAGASKVLDQLDIVILELSLIRLDAGGKVFSEMIELLDSLGFRYFDDAGIWRCPVDGQLLQKDGLFARKGLFPDRA